MAFFGIGIDPKIQTENEFEPVPKVGYVQGVEESLKSTLETDPVANIIHSGEIGHALMTDPGKWVSAAEIKANPEYAGLDFPYGAAQSTLDLAKKNFDAQQKSAEIMDNVGSGLLQTPSDFIAKGVGFLIDPLNIATTALVPEAIGSKAATTAFKLSQATGLDAVKGIATRMGYGAAEGTLDFLPQQITQTDVNAQLGEAPQPVQILESLGMGAGLGAVIHGIGGTYKLYSDKGKAAIAETAVTQGMNDRPVDVNTVAKAAYNEARKDDAPITQNVPKVDEEQIPENLVQAHSETYGLTPEESRNNLQAEQLIKENPHISQDPQEIKADMESMNDIDNDSAYEPGQNARYQTQIDDTPEDPMTDFDELDRQVEAMRENGEIKETDQDYQDVQDLKAHADAWEDIRTKLKDYLGCVLGGGSG